MRVRIDREVRRRALADDDRGPPLGEAGAELPVLGESLAQAVEPFGDRLAREQRHRLRADVDLDAGDRAGGLEHLDERDAVVGRLPDRLVVQDHAADMRSEIGRREQHLPVGATGVLGAVHADRVEALLDRAGGLVGGKDPLAGRDQRLGRRVRGVGHRGSSLLERGDSVAEVMARA